METMPKREEPQRGSSGRVALRLHIIGLFVEGAYRGSRPWRTGALLEKIIFEGARRKIGWAVGRLCS